MYYPESEYTFEQEDESPNYRSLSMNLSQAAAESTYDFDAEESPVYRSVQVGTTAMRAHYADPSCWDLEQPTPAKTAQKAGLEIETETQTDNVLEPNRKCVLYQLEHTHMRLSSSFHEIMSRVTESLEAVGAVFEFKAQKHKFKCHLHSRIATVSFSVRIFSADPGSTFKYIVEVQKRYGCSLVFYELWRILNSALDPCAPKLAVTPLDTLSPRTQQGDVGVPVDNSTVKIALRQLIGMVDSGMLDIQRNALVSLDNISFDISKSRAILEEMETEVFERLCACVSEVKDTETLTRSLSAMSNLLLAVADSKLLSATELVVVAAIAPIMQLLRQNTNAASLNLHVQAVRTLSCISTCVQSSCSVLSGYKCGEILECKVRQCNLMVHTQRPATSLAELQKQVAANLVACA
jgi:hypothetical protein